MEKMEIWNNLYKPPTTALKTIRGGRLSGMTDIKPIWRYEALTKQFGPCGIGWKFHTIKTWTEQGPFDTVMVFVTLEFFFKFEEKWSDAIEGTGGSTLIAKEKSGLRGSDEAYKMAMTDALGTAVKMIGVGGAIYAGKFDGSKYIDEPKQQTPVLATEDQQNQIRVALAETTLLVDEFLATAKLKSIDEFTQDRVSATLKYLAGLPKREQETVGQG